MSPIPPCSPAMLFLISILYSCWALSWLSCAVNTFWILWSKRFSWAFKVFSLSLYLSFYSTGFFYFLLPPLISFSSCSSLFFLSLSRFSFIFWSSSWTCLRSSCRLWIFKITYSSFWLREFTRTRCRFFCLNVSPLDSFWKALELSICDGVLESRADVSR